MSTPKKRRLKTTSAYIYSTLFEGGSNSDVAVEALGREWRLHRLYLRQSPFFASLFSGAWREGVEQERVRITVADPNVTEDALHLALGSLYQVRLEDRKGEQDELTKAQGLPGIEFNVLLHFATVWYCIPLQHTIF